MGLKLHNMSPCTSCRLHELYSSIEISIMGLRDFGNDEMVFTKQYVSWHLLKHR